MNLFCLYLCKSEIKGKWQFLGMTKFTVEDDGTTVSMNYSYTDTISRFEKLSGYLGLNINISANTQLVSVSDGVEIQFVPGFENKHKANALAVINKTRKEIAEDKECIMLGLPKLQFHDEYTAKILHHISGWAKSESSLNREGLKEINSTIQRAVCQQLGFEYKPYEEISNKYPQEDEDKKEKEEAEKKAKEEAERKEKELEELKEFPKKSELMVNLDINTIMPQLSTIKRIENLSDSVNELRKIKEEFKKVILYECGPENKYVENGEVKKLVTPCWIEYEGMKINYTNPDLVKDSYSKYKEIINLIKEKEEEIRIKDGEIDKEEFEEQKIITVSNEPVEETPIGKVEKETSFENAKNEWNKTVRDELSSYDISYNNYGDYTKWSEQFLDRVSIEIPEEEADDIPTIFVVCKSTQSGNPILTGMINRESVRILENEDGEIIADNKKAANSYNVSVSYELQYSHRIEEDIISTLPYGLSRYNLKYTLSMNPVGSRFTFDWATTPLIELEVGPNDIPNNLPVLFVDCSRKDVTEEIVLESINKQVGEESLRDSLEDWKSLALIAYNLISNSSFEENLNTRSFVVSPKVQELIGDNEYLELYLKQQKEEYFDLSNTINGIKQQNTDMDYFFAPVKTSSEARTFGQGTKSVFENADVINPLSIFIGLNKRYKYWYSSHYIENLNVEREYYKATGYDDEQISSMLSEHKMCVTGSAENANRPIMDWEEPMFKSIKRKIDAEIIQTYDIKSYEELKNAIEEGKRAPEMENILIQWCNALYAMGYMYTGYVTNVNAIEILGINAKVSEAYDTSNFKLRMQPLSDTYKLSQIWSVGNTGMGMRTDGFQTLERYVYTYSNSYSWAHAFIHMCRWGTNKELYLRLPNANTVYDYKLNQIVKPYKDSSGELLNNEPLQLIEILSGKYVLKEYKGKHDSMIYANINPDKYDKYLKGIVTNGRPANFKNVYASLFTAFYRIDGEGNAADNIYLDTLSMLNSMVNNKGQVEIRDKNGNINLIDVEGVKFDEELNRISIDDSKWSSESNGVYEPEFPVRLEPNLVSSELSYEQANKHALNRYLKYTDAYVSENIEQSGEVIPVTKVRPSDVNFLKDASDCNYLNDSIRGAFEVFIQFMEKGSFPRNEDKELLKLSEKYAMPYIIADFLYSRIVGDQTSITAKYDSEYSVGKPSNLEVYWNCVVYGIQLCWYNNEMPIDEFIDAVMRKDGVFNFGNNELNTTNHFEDDPRSERMKKIVEKKVQLGTPITQVIVVTDVPFDNKYTDISSKRLIGYKIEKSVYFFLEGSYDNVIITDKTNVASLKNPKFVGFFKNVQTMGGLGYQTPRLKKAFEDALIKL